MKPKICSVLKWAKRWVEDMWKNNERRVELNTIYSEDGGEEAWHFFLCVFKRASASSSPHSCLLSLRACLSLASKAALVSISSSSCRRIRAMSSWEVSHCSLRAADSTLSCVAARESCSLCSRHCSCILLASFRRDSTLTATDSHWFSDMFWTETERGQRSNQEP